MPHMRPPHAPHHHEPHHHGPHAHEWFYNEEEWRSPAEAGERLVLLARALAPGTTLELGDLTVSLPGEFDVELVHEPTPHGEFVMRVDLKWRDRPGPGRHRHPHPR